VTATERLKLKICLVGEAGVGKSSLIRRYVLNEFDDRYISTVGTKVSKKEIQISFPKRDLDLDVTMAIWDIMGQHLFRDLLQEAYFSGAQGVLAVADLTRPETIDALYGWIDAIDRVVEKVPVIIAVNKCDLVSQAECRDDDVKQVAEALHCDYFATSAKSGKNVEEAFRVLGTVIAESQLSPT
jgi:small GTP-binding protein